MALIPKQTSIQPDTDAADRDMARRKMSTELRAISDRWQRRRAAENNNSIELFYELALDVLMVAQDPDRYTDSGVDLLFDANGMDRHSQRNYRNVGRHFTRKEIDEIVAYNATPAGVTNPIYSSHLITLSAVSDEVFRKQMIAKICVEGTSTAALRDLVQNFLAANPDASNRGPSPSIRPTNLVKNVLKLTTSLANAFDELNNDEFLSALDTVKAQDIDKTLEHVEGAWAKTKELCEIVSGSAEALRTVRENLLQRKKVAEARKDSMADVVDEVESKKAAKKKAASKSGNNLPPTGGVKKKKKKKSADAPADSPAPTGVKKKVKRKVNSATGEVVRVKKRVKPGTGTVAATTEVSAGKKKVRKKRSLTTANTGS